MPTEVDRISREHVEAFIADQLARWRSKTAQVRYGGLRQFFRWALEEGEITTSPMANMRPPSVPEVPVPVVSDEHLERSVKATDGPGFEQRRDAAIIRVLFDCGIRLGELTSLQVDDVDFDVEVVVVVGKGSRTRSVPFSPKTGQAIDRYLRVRKGHAHVAPPDLWLGAKGPLQTSGVAQMIRRRCADAGIEPLHPHQLRHTAAHNWLGMGGNEGDAMRVCGWRSAQMLNRYGAGAADERARDPSPPPAAVASMRSLGMQEEMSQSAARVVSDSRCGAWATRR